MAREKSLTDADIEWEDDVEWEQPAPDEAVTPPNVLGTPYKALGVPARIKKIYSPEEKSIDYKSGVPNMTLRAKLGLASTDEEKLNVLEGMAGSGQVGLTREGKYFIRPEGLKKLGIKSDVPRVIDEPMPTMYDLADLSGDIPAIAGGIAGGVATRGMSLLPGMLGTAAGAGGGSAMKEFARSQAGVGPFQPGQVAAEAGYGALGELGARTLGALGRKLMAPGASTMTPARQQLMESALARGYMPTADQVREGALLARPFGVVRQIWGHPGQKENVQTALREFKHLVAEAGKPTSKEAIGEQSVQALRQARDVFGAQARARFDQIDDIVVPTNALKRQALKILDELPLTKEGAPVFADAETTGFLRNISQLPDNLSVGKMQQVRTELREAATTGTLAPKLPKRHSAMLFKAADRVFDDAARLTSVSRTSTILGPEGKPLVTTTPLDPKRQANAILKLREADAFYKSGIRQFDTAVMNRLVKDASKAGAVDPDQFMDFVIRPGHAVRARQVISMLPEPQKERIRGTFASDLLKPLVQKGDKPFESILRGDMLESELDRYGPNVLDAVMGVEWRKAAYSLATTVKMVTAGNKNAGGLVVAHTMLQIPTDPIGAGSKVGAFRMLYKVMRNKVALKYLTTGIRAPNTQIAAGYINKALMQIGAQTGEPEGGELEFLNRVNLQAEADVEENLQQ